jgi:hypothetical protein
MTIDEIDRTGNITCILSYLRLHFSSNHLKICRMYLRFRFSFPYFVLPFSRRFFPLFMIIGDPRLSLKMHTRFCARDT